MNILLVDDDSQVITYIQRILTRWGHDHSSAQTGEQALALFSGHDFDLILLDVFLPDTVAYELIPRFKAINPDIGIVTMTGNNTRDLELQVREQGILYYMVKPIEANNLQLLLDHIHNKHGSNPK